MLGDPWVTRKPSSKVKVPVYDLDMARQAVIKAAQADAKQRNQQAPSEETLARFVSKWATSQEAFREAMGIKKIALQYEMLVESKASASPRGGQARDYR